MFRTNILFMRYPKKILFCPQTWLHALCRVIEKTSKMLRLAIFWLPSYYLGCTLGLPKKRYYVYSILFMLRKRSKLIEHHQGFFRWDGNYRQVRHFESVFCFLNPQTILKCPSLQVLYQPAHNTIITEPFQIAWHRVNVLLYFAIKPPKLLYISWSTGSPYIVEEDKRILATGFDCRQKPLCDANAVCTTDPVNGDHHVCVCNSGFQGNGSLCHGKRKISPFQT